MVNKIELVEINNRKILKEINSDSIKIYNIHFNINKIVQVIMG